ncbi:hypothetical protein ACM66B_006429 [Microbotryomycetes sp. NB124-2]
MSRTVKRLLSELHDFDSRAEGDAGSDGVLSLSPVSDDDMLTWHAAIAGPESTPFEGSALDLDIIVPTAYPAHPPQISFRSGAVFHPNVNFRTGEICLDVLKAEWSPVWTLAASCRAVQALLAAPEPSSPLNVDAANLLRDGDLLAYGQLIRLHTRDGGLEAAASSGSSRVLRFNGHGHLRRRLILSLLSRRPVRIDGIRADDEQPGLRPYEVSFLRLLEKLSDGTRIEISFTGTSLLFHPGTLTGGRVAHTCPLERSVGWFLEPLLAIAPFGKKDLDLTLHGITTDGIDASVDTIRVSGLPHLAMFLEVDGLELRITKRGYPPLGGGQVTLTCPIVRAVKSGFDFTNAGRINKIRGIAHAVRVSPQMANRLVAAARSVLNRYIPDVYVYTDVYKGEDSGKSPGYAITLVASSSSHVVRSSEATSSSRVASDDASSEASLNPEDLGLLAARQLLTEITRAGCVDRGWEWLVTLMLVLGGEDVGRIAISGPLDALLVQHMRDLRAFFGTSFKIKTIDSAADDKQSLPAAEVHIMSCVGTGFTNTAKRT